MPGPGLNTAVAAAAQRLAVLSLGLLLFSPEPVHAQNLGEMVQAVKQAQDNNSLFGSVEIRRDSLRGLQQWQRVISAMRVAGPAFNNCARNAGACTSPMLKRWREIVTAAKAQPYENRLKSINTSFNRWPYKLDIEVYGVREYWATPKEFIINSGDCEDYSIAKYYALRNVGFSNDELRIVVLQDTIRGFGHAVMAAYVGDDILILDNTTQLVLPHSKFGHYDPKVSMNETSRWAHVASKARRSKSASGDSLSAGNLFQRRE